MLLALPPNQNGYETRCGRTGVFFCLLGVVEADAAGASTATGGAVVSGIVRAAMAKGDVSLDVCMGLFCFVLFFNEQDLLQETAACRPGRTWQAK